MKNPWEEYGPAPLVNPWETYGGPRAPADATPERKEVPLPEIDFSRPEGEVRAAVAKIADPDVRKRVLDKWADAFVETEYGDKGKRKSEPASGMGKVLADVLSAIPDYRRTEGGSGRTSSDAPIRNIARGTLAGTWADELNALTYGGVHKLTNGLAGKPYDEVLAYQRALDRWNDKQDPVGSLALQVGGAIAGPQVVANALMKGATTLPGKMVRGAGVGAVGGAIAGSGNADKDKIEGAETGASIGAVVGAALPPAVQGVTYGISKAADLVNPSLARWRNGPDAAAEKILGQRLRGAGVSPADVQKELDAGGAARQIRGNSQADLPETIADTSNSMQRLLGSVYRSGGEAGDFVKGGLDARQRGPRNLYAPSKSEPTGQQERILDAVDRSMGISTAKGAYRTEQGLVQTMKKEANENYRLATDRQEPFDLQPAFDAMALKIQQYPPPVAAQLSKALGYFVNDKNAAAGAAIARITKGMDDLTLATTEQAQASARGLIQNGFKILQQTRAKGNAPFAVDEIRRFDYAKRALDDLIDGAEGNVKRELVEFKNGLLDLVHAPSASGAIGNPFYKVAREAFAEGKRGQDAIELGRNAFKIDPEAFVDQYRALDAAQQKMARIGLRDAVRAKLASTKPGSDTTQFFQQKQVVDLLTEVIPGRAKPERFGEYMAREQRMAQTRNVALGGSQTAERLNDDVQFAGNVLSQMWSRFKDAPSIKGAVIESIGYGLQRAFAFRQDVARSMAQRLLEADPEKQRAILLSIERRMGPDAFEHFADELNRRALSVGTSFIVQQTRPNVPIESR